MEVQLGWQGCRWLCVKLVGVNCLFVQWWFELAGRSACVKLEKEASSWFHVGLNMPVRWSCREVHVCLTGLVDTGSRWFQPAVMWMCV